MSNLATSPADAPDHAHEHAGLGQVEGVEAVELGQDLFVAVTQCLQQDGHRHLAATVDTEVQQVFRVELEVQPGTAVRNDAGGEQQLAGGVGLAAVVLEEHARGTVQLGNDDAFGTVDDEGAVGGHERNFAHVNFLLAHFFTTGLDDSLSRMVRRIRARSGAHR
jgi:hypothetical protein